MGISNIFDNYLTYTIGRVRTPFMARFVLPCLFILAGVVSSTVSADPLVTNPLSDAPISNNTETFQWNANGESVSEWWLYVGTSVGGNEIHDSGSISSGTYSEAVTNLPVDGSTVWVRLWYDSDHWRYIDIEYSAATGGSEPEITVPVPVARLSGETETFEWISNGESVSEWWLYVGTSVGGKEIHDSGSINSGTYSATVSSLPVDGSTVWVRLWYRSDSWHSIDFQYNAVVSGSSEPAITLPAPGTQLSGDAAAFQWSANGTVVSNWTLTAGSSVGGSEYYNSGALGSGTLSVTASGLPTDGRDVWVRLEYVTDQQYSVDYLYTAAGSAGEPEIIAPVPNAQLTSSTETFQWISNGESVSEWWLYVGASVGGKEIHDSGSINSGTDTAAVSGLPVDGGTVWVRLWYRSDSWHSIDFQYNAVVSGSSEPAITQPAPGEQLSGEVTTFQWSANGESVSEWWLYVGTSVGGNEIHDSGSINSGTDTATVSGLPVDGSIVWVRLWYRSDSWHSIDFQYNAVVSGSSEPAITQPAPGEQLSGEVTTFQWSANGESVSEWWLYVGTSVGGNEIHDSGSINSGTDTATVSGLPVDGSIVWVRLWYDSNHWHSIDFQYTANNGGIWIVSPVSNELMNQNDVDVQATATDFPQNWSVDFVLDGQFNNAIQGILSQGTTTWHAALGDLSKQTHTLTAIMVDETGVQQVDFSHEITFDIGDYYVAFGDSISEGIGDDVSSDDQSLDGRNSSTGYTPILNDLLSANKGYPHSVVVQGISGYDAGDGLAEIDDVLVAHPEASHFLIQFGTNDSGDPVPSGLNRQPGEGGYPGTFKDNMQQIIDAVQTAGKIALIAKAPIRYGDCSGPSKCQSYFQDGIIPDDAAANGFVREYNQVVDELIQENGLELDPIGLPGVLFVAPDLYTFFNATGLDSEGKSPSFNDWLHPNGVGYQDMADLWRDTLLP